MWQILQWWPSFVDLSRHLYAEHFSWLRRHGRQRIQEASDVAFMILYQRLTPYLERNGKVKGKTAKSFQLIGIVWFLTKVGEELFIATACTNLTNPVHEIKDLPASKTRAVCAVWFNCRWVVTGTLIQNRLSELFSLFHLLRLHPYCEKENFDKAITNPWLNGDGRGYQRLVKLLGDVMLRRPKTTISLPKRQDHRRIIDLSP